MSKADEILQIVRALPPVGKRVPRMKRPPRVKTPADTYDWLINEWMPGQADFDALAHLTVLLHFDMVLVTAAIVGGEPKFIEYLERRTA